MWAKNYLNWYFRFLLIMQKGFPKKNVFFHRSWRRVSAAKLMKSTNQPENIKSKLCLRLPLRNFVLTPVICLVWQYVNIRFWIVSFNPDDSWLFWSVGYITLAWSGGCRKPIIMETPLVPSSFFQWFILDNLYRFAFDFTKYYQMFLQLFF